MKRMLLLVGLAAGGGIGALLLVNRQNRDMDREFEAGQRRLLTHWAQAPYLPITNSAEFGRQILARIEACDTHQLLAGRVGGELARSIVSLCRAYSQADFEAFLEFRLPKLDPASFEIQPENLAEMKKQLPGIEAVQAVLRAQRPGPPNRLISLDRPLGVLEAWWYLQAARAEKSGERAAEPLLCLSCWKEFSPARFKVLVERRQSPPPDLLRLANQLEPVSSAMDLQSLGIKVRPDPEELMLQGKSVLFAHCLIPVKLNSTLQARPVLVSFYWSEGHDKFLPHRMAVLASDLAVLYAF